MCDGMFEVEKEFVEYCYNHLCDAPEKYLEDVFEKFRDFPSIFVHLTFLGLTYVFSFPYFKFTCVLTFSG